MAPTVASLGGTASAANGTTKVLTLGASVAVGDTIVVAVAIDNTGTSGAAPATLTLSDSKSHSWGSPANTQLVDPSTASSGAYLAMWRVLCTTAVTTSDTITVTTGSSAAIAISAAKVTPTSGYTLTDGTNGSTTTTAGTTATITTGTLAAGELVFGFAATERTSAVTGDTDTSNGSWSTAVSGLGGNSGTSTSNMTSILQWKTVTASATQTFNTSWTTATDSCIGYFTFIETAIPSGPTFVYANNFSYDGPGTSPYITVPATAAAGDKAYILASNQASAALSYPPAGWTTEFVSSGGRRFILVSKTLVSGDIGANVVFPLTPAYYSISMQIICIRGAATFTFGSLVENDYQTTISATGPTTMVADTLLVSFLGIADEGPSGTSSPSSGWTQLGPKVNNYAMGDIAWQTKSTPGSNSVTWTVGGSYVGLNSALILAAAPSTPTTFNEAYLGATQVSDLRVGSATVSKVYLGATQLWP